MSLSYDSILSGCSHLGYQSVFDDHVIDILIEMLRKLCSRDNCCKTMPFPDSGSAGNRILLASLQSDRDPNDY